MILIHKANPQTKAVKQVALHPMVAKVAHPQTTPQAKQVKGQEMVKEHRQTVKVDKAMAILKAVKVKVIPIVVRVKEMVTVKEMVKVTEMAAILIHKAMAGLMAQVKAKVTVMEAVKKETATIVVVKVAMTKNVRFPKAEMSPIVEKTVRKGTKRLKKTTKAEILPKKEILIAEIRAIPPSKATLMVERGMMERVKVLAFLPMIKKHYNNVLKKPKMQEIPPKNPCNKPMDNRHERMLKMLAVPQTKHRKSWIEAVATKKTKN